MTANSNILQEKLTKFIRKYYINKTINGVLLFLVLLIPVVILTSFFEYVFNFNTVIKSIIFYSVLIFSLLMFVFGVFLPVLKIFKLAQTIEKQQAAQIIGKHFEEISDKLLNILQLEEMAAQNQNQLLLASIDQKTKELKTFTFTEAIQIFKNNSKRIIYTTVASLIFLLMLVFVPDILSEPIQRIVYYNKDFTEPVKYEILIKNKTLEVEQNQDFELQILLEGTEFPSEILIEYNNKSFKPQKASNNEYSYIFKKVKNKTSFIISTPNFISPKYELLIYNTPSIRQISVFIDYPSYTKIEDKLVENIGDLNVPCGTKITWNIFSKNTEKIFFLIDSNLVSLAEDTKNKYVFNKTALRSFDYRIKLVNAKTENKENIKYSIRVINDAFPKINVQEHKDSLNEDYVFFTGEIKDDYGFSSLFLYVETKNKSWKEKIEITRQREQDFYFFFDFTSIDIDEGESVKYYFKVTDNDIISGPKSTKSRIETHRKLTEDEKKEQLEKNKEELNQDLQKLIDNLKKIQKEIDDLNSEIKQKNKMDWEDKEKLEELLKKQEQVQRDFEKIKKQNEFLNNKDETSLSEKEEILKKQQELNELFEEIMSEEMKRQLEEMQKLMEQMDKRKIQQELDIMNQDNKLLEQDLNRSLELMKQLEFDKKMTETIEKLNELAEQQEKLSELTKEKELPTEEIIEKQDNIQKEFDQIKKDIEELNTKNQDLKDPNNFKKPEEKTKQTQEDLNNSMQNLEKSKEKKASENQEDASKKMQEMADAMSEMQMGMEMESAAEDIRTLREILENLISISFQQENIMKEIKSTSSNSPKYQEIIQEQHQLNKNFVKVEDSLSTLAMRQAQIKPFILKEVSKIDFQLENTVKLLTEHKTSPALARQQYAMTSINNIALFLAEIMKNMQQQMNQMQKKCNSQCKKPGNKPKPGDKPSPKTMKQMQEQLNQQMEQMKNGTQKPGQSRSEMFARYAAQQEAIRRMLQEHQKSLLEKDDTEGNNEIQKAIKYMEQTEEDLVNKRITQEMLNRQKEILVRLMNEEKAQEERDYEEKRKSEEAKKEFFSNPNAFFQYKRDKKGKEELLKTMPPQLKSYYKLRVNQYFYNFE
jgi:hypothetical protein